jgi:cyclic pyranopterin phosphate synthase
MQALNVSPECDQLPSGSKLVDGYGRTINYLRLAVTDRCNLCCRYCMPKEGISPGRRSDILSFEEIMRLVEVTASCGISKLRFTGGEPFVRRDFMRLLEAVYIIPGIKSIHITSNGVAVAKHVPRLKELGIAGFNLSLDSLNPDRFSYITRRDALDSVKDTLDGIVQAEIPLKINVVVQQGINTDEIVTLAGLAKSRPLTVRFIEQMPFNGKGTPVSSRWDSRRILDELKKYYPAMQRSIHDSGTARLYNIPGFTGTIGIIGAYSRHFCRSCNKIRVTPQGLLKTCLYDNGNLDLRSLLRNGSTTMDTDLASALIQAVVEKPENGYTAEENSQGSHASMASIGG